MRLGEVFRFELGYRVRQPSTWFGGLVLLGLPLLLMGILDGSTAKANAPEMVATGSALVGMLGMLVTAALFGDAAARDIETRLHSLFYASPLTPGEYLWGRWLAVLLVNAVLVAGIPIGFMLAPFVPWAPPPEAFGPFRPAAYAQAWAFFLLPNLVLASAVLFAVAAKTRHTVTAYLTAVGLFVLYLLNASFGVVESLAGPVAAQLLDPFAVTVLNTLTEYWTPAELDARLIGLPPILLWNRALWIGMGFGVLAVLHARFRFAHPGAGGRRPRLLRWRRAREERLAAAVAEGRVGARGGSRRGAHGLGDAAAAPAVLRTERRFGPGTTLRQLGAVTRESLRRVVLSRSFAVIAAVALFVFFIAGSQPGDNVFGTFSWPLTHLLAGDIVVGSLALVVVVLIVVFAGELVWQERDGGIADIADAAPVPDRVLLGGKFIALVVAVALLQAAFMAGGIAIQAAAGYHRFEPGLYVAMLFGLQLVDYALMAALALAVHVVVHSKLVGHLVVVAYYAVAHLTPLLGNHHNLAIYGGDPGWTWSDMSGFGPFLGPWLWFKLYWAAWALLLALASAAFWVRGRETRARARLARARQRFAALGRPAAAATVLVVTLGGFIFYNTNVLNEYHGTAIEKTAAAAEYERRYAHLDRAPQPEITHMALRVEILPEEPAAVVDGSYVLRNRTAVPIDSVHVALSDDTELEALELDRPSRAALVDDARLFRIYELDSPLAPGDSMRLDFRVAFRTRGFTNDALPTDVLANGAYFDGAWMPLIGYQPAREIQEEAVREEHGLPPQAPVPPAHDRAALGERSVVRNVDRVGIEAVIGTAADQTAVAAGRLVRTWMEGGRRYFHYRTDEPIPVGAPVLSAEYAVLEDRWRGDPGDAPGGGDVALMIFHHPTHGFNLERMMRSMKASLEYFTREFGPYEYDELRIVEFPRYASFARAHPHTITFSEGGAFLTRVEEDDVDRTFFVVAHETAHQWFGGVVAGAEVEGSTFLSESLAQYGAMMVMEKTYGPEHVRLFYDYAMDYYLAGRRGYANTEAPLLRTSDGPHIYYFKGAVALYALRQRIGEDAMNLALRRYLDRFRDAGPPYPTSLDLYRELQGVTPDSLQGLLVDLLETMTLWDLRTESATAEPVDGGWRVSLDVTGRKLRADDAGVDHEVPMDDLVQIGVFAPAADGEERGAPLYLGEHRIRTGHQTITVVVPERPAEAGIDPHRQLIDRSQGDNVQDIRIP